MNNAPPIHLALGIKAAGHLVTKASPVAMGPEILARRVVELLRVAASHGVPMADEVLPFQVLKVHPGGRLRMLKLESPAALLESFAATL